MTYAKCKLLSTVLGTQQILSCSLNSYCVMNKPQVDTFSLENVLFKCRKPTFPAHVNVLNIHLENVATYPYINALQEANLMQA